MTTPNAAAPAPAAARGLKFSWVPLAAVGLVVLLALLYILVNARNPDLKAPDRIPTRFILPQGFTGNIKITYEVPGAPPLPVEDGHQVIEVPLSGRLETSSSPEYGFSKDDLFQRRDADGGFETLNSTQWLRRRRNGIEGDTNEYFLYPEQELALRDEALRQAGRFDEAGNVIDARPYQLLVLRDDFDPRAEE